MNEVTHVSHILTRAKWRVIEKECRRLQDKPNDFLSAGNRQLLDAVANRIAAALLGHDPQSYPLPDGRIGIGSTSENWNKLLAALHFFAAGEAYEITQELRQVNACDV